MNYHNEIRAHLSLEKDAPISRAPNSPGTFLAAQFSAGYTTNMSGFDLRQAQPERSDRCNVVVEFVGLGTLFEDCSAFTRVAACTLALSPICDTLIEGFSHFVTSMTAPIASGWSRLPDGICTHWKAPPLHGAHPEQT
jgi:hypothetical protein